jgi:hypothetical protein
VDQAIRAEAVFIDFDVDVHVDDLPPGFRTRTILAQSRRGAEKLQG